MADATRKGTAQAVPFLMPMKEGETEMYMVYQLSTEPIDGCDLMAESDFFDTPFLRSVAEGVTSEINTDTEKRILFDSMEKKGAVCNRENQTLKFPPAFIKTYFQGKFLRFKELAEDMRQIDLHLFCNGKLLESKLDHAAACFNDRLGSYVYIDDEIITFDEFVRDTNPEQVYYLGNVLGYK